MTKVLVLYYSSYSHTETMAQAVAEGAGSVDGVEVTLKRVPETMPEDVARNAGVKLDQEADVTIDAIPNQTFKGRVIEIGNTAILRSTGLAASQSAISSQEAKDFKVVVALTNPPVSTSTTTGRKPRKRSASGERALFAAAADGSSGGVGAVTSGHAAGASPGFRLHASARCCRRGSCSLLVRSMTRAPVRRCRG